MALRFVSFSFATALVLSGCFTDVSPVESDVPTEVGTSGNTSSDQSGTTTSVGDGDSDSDSTSSAMETSGRTSGASGTDSSGGGSSTSGSSESGPGSTTNTEPPTVCPSFADDFESPSFDPLWIPVDGGSISVGDGEAVINVTAAFNDEFARLQLLPEPNGLVGASARIEIGTPPPVEGVVIMLWVQPTSGGDRISYSLANRGAETRLEARLVPEVGSPVIMNTVVWDPSMTWMQLREEAGTLYFEASVEGLSFETIYEVGNTIDVSSAFVGFVGNNGMPLEEDVEVSVRTFEIECG